LPMPPSRCRPPERRPKGFIRRAIRFSPWQVPCSAFRQSRCRCSAMRDCRWGFSSSASSRRMRLSSVLPRGFAILCRARLRRPMKLAVPDIISNSYFPAAAAIELGFFKEEGLDVELELIYPVDRCYAALRDGAVDFVGGSAHSALAAFPQWQGVKLLCAQAQGMYWFLVLHKDFGAARGDIGAVKGKNIGAAPWVELGLRRNIFVTSFDHAVRSANIT